MWKINKKKHFKIKNYLIAWWPYCTMIIHKVLLVNEHRVLIITVVTSNAFWAYFDGACVYLTREYDSFVFSTKWHLLIWIRCKRSTKCLCDLYNILEIQIYSIVHYQCHVLLIMLLNQVLHPVEIPQVRQELRVIVNLWLGWSGCSQFM